MKALVTGGAGFIGSHLVDLLLNEGFEIIVVDNLSTGRKKNLIQHEQNDKITFIHDDVNNISSHDDLLNNVTHVYHLAALADIVPSIENPREYFRANVDGTFEMVEYFKNKPIKKFVYAASSSCYGIPDSYPTDEDQLISTEYPYALTKYLGEEIIRHYAKVYGFPSISLRLFNVYGYRARTKGTYGAVMGVFLGQYLNKKPLTIVGDGKQKRDFIYVKDVVRAFYLASKSDYENSVYNIGCGSPRSVIELADIIQEERVFMPKRPGEPDMTYADISKVKKEIGWEPMFTLECGMKEIFENIESFKDAPAWDVDQIRVATKLWFKYLK